MPMEGEVKKERPSLGLALGGGSARGLAHIGVLQVFEAEGIPVDYLAGTSMGGLIGAFYASGMNLKMMQRLAKKIEKRLWFDLTIPKMGIIAGEKITQILHFLTRNCNFQDLKIPFAVSATDLYSGENITISEGNLADAVRATISIPGIFPPVEWQNYLLVDGGVLNRVPVGIVKEMGADLIVAVDVGVYIGKRKTGNIFDVINQTFDIMSREIQKHTMSPADIIICPDLTNVGSAQYHKVDEAVAQGEKAAREALPEIKKKLERGMVNEE